MKNYFAFYNGIIKDDEITKTIKAFGNLYFYQWKDITLIFKEPLSRNQDITEFKESKFDIDGIELCFDENKKPSFWINRAGLDDDTIYRFAAALNMSTDNDDIIEYIITFNKNLKKYYEQYGADTGSQAHVTLFSKKAII